MTIELTTATQTQKTNILGVLGSFASHRFKPRHNMVISMVGDSNTNGRPGWQAAVDAEWVTRGGVFEGCTIYNNGANGSQLSGWAANIVTLVNSARNPLNSNVANPWDVVEGDPDLIMIKLGTNDYNTPAARAALGIESVFRANLATLVNFFIEQTSAVIWLCLPQPFTWGETTDDFDYLTQWADDAACAASSATMRAMYLEWENRHPRVMVYDSHKHLFGYSCDDKSEDCLDPDTGAELIDDALHCTNLGYRRYAQQMAEQFTGEAHPFKVRTIPDAIRETAKWSADFWVRANTTTLISIDFTPELAFTKTATSQTNPVSALSNNSSSPLSRKRQSELALAQEIIPPTIYQQLMNTAGSMNILFHATGNSYTFTKPTISQIVNANDPHYVVVSLVGLSSNLQAGDIGRCTIWTAEQSAIPYDGLRRLEDVELFLPSGATIVVKPQMIDLSSALAVQLGRIVCNRNGGNAVTYQLRARNQADGRFLTTETFTTGKPIADITFASGFYTSTIVWRKELWPSGFLLTEGMYLSLDVLTGTNNANVSLTVARRGGLFPVWTTQPASMSVSAGADAAFTSLATGGLAYQWQISTASGPTDANVVFVNISGATSANYTRSTVIGDNGYRIRCIVRYRDPGSAMDMWYGSDHAILSVS